MSPMSQLALFAENQLYRGVALTKQQISNNYKIRLTVLKDMLKEHQELLPNLLSLIHI